MRESFVYYPLVTCRRGIVKLTPFSRGRRHLAELRKFSCFLRFSCVCVCDPYKVVSEPLEEKQRSFSVAGKFNLLGFHFERQRLINRAATSPMV